MLSTPKEATARPLSWLLWHPREELDESYSKSKTTTPRIILLYISSVKTINTFREPSDEAKSYIIYARNRGTSLELLNTLSTENTDRETHTYDTQRCVFGLWVIAFFSCNFSLRAIFSFNRAAPAIRRRLCVFDATLLGSHTYVCLNSNNRIYTRNRQKRSAVKKKYQTCKLFILCDVLIIKVWKPLSTILLKMVENGYAETFIRIRQSIAVLLLILVLSSLSYWDVTKSYNFQNIKVPHTTCTTLLCRLPLIAGRSGLRSVFFTCRLALPSRNLFCRALVSRFCCSQEPVNDWSNLGTHSDCRRR